MNIYLTLLFLISTTTAVHCGFLTGHHPFPANLISSRTFLSGAAGGGPSSGAYSSSQLTQTVATSPTQVHSSISTHHPSNYGYNYRGNQGNGFNQGQFIPNSGSNQGYGQGQNQANSNYNGYTNIPSVIAYGTYGYGGQNSNQGGPNQGSSNQGGSNQGSSHGGSIQGGSYQNQGSYYQGLNQEYGYGNLGNNYGRY